MEKRRTNNFILIAILLLLLPLQVIAQKYPTRFLGFPVDGPKEQMIKNLQSKGFEYNSSEDYFTGVYYGQPVYIVLKIRDGKLNRVLVYDIIQREAADIKKRFNEVYKRFQQDNNYVCMEYHDKEIARHEKIMVGINHYSSVYKAVFGQKATIAADSVREQKRALEAAAVSSVDTKVLKANFRERCRRIHAKALARSVSTTDDRYMNQVWFAISEKYGKYALIQSFDNLYNFTQPSEEEGRNYLK